jgi:hypothetical protein
MKVTVELSNDSVAALADALAVRLTAVPKGGQASATERFVTRSEATRMGVERRALLRAERSGRLEAFRPGRVVVYRCRDVEALVESHKILPEAKASATSSVEGLHMDRFERALQNGARRSRPC